MGVQAIKDAISRVEQDMGSAVIDGVEVNKAVYVDEIASAAVDINIAVQKILEEMKEQGAPQEQIEKFENVLGASADIVKNGDASDLGNKWRDLMDVVNEAMGNAFSVEATEELAEDIKIEDLTPEELNDLLADAARRGDFGSPDNTVWENNPEDYHMPSILDVDTVGSKKPEDHQMPSTHGGGADGANPEDFHAITTPDFDQGQLPSDIDPALVAALSGGESLLPDSSTPGVNFSMGKI